MNSPVLSLAQLSGAACLQKVEGIVTRPVCGELLLVPSMRSVGDVTSIYALNDSAAVVWSLVDGRRTIEQICRDASGQFQVERAGIEADIRALIQQFLDFRFIEQIGAEMPAAGQEPPGQPPNAGAPVSYQQPQIMQVVLDPHQGVLGFCNSASLDGLGGNNCSSMVCWQEG
jgi:hypothetical protein